MRSTAKTALILGIVAASLPALAIALIWAVNPDKDYGFLFYGGTVALSVPPSIIAGVLALWKKEERAWQAWVGLSLGLLATCVYVLGGLAFYLLLSLVLGHD